MASFPQSLQKPDGMNIWQAGEGGTKAEVVTALTCTKCQTSWSWATRLAWPSSQRWPLSPLASGRAWKAVPLGLKADTFHCTVLLLTAFYKTLKMAVGCLLPRCRRFHRNPGKVCRPEVVQKCQTLRYSCLNTYATRKNVSIARCME
jgi:hypothetical protein